MIRASDLVSAANGIGAAARIALARPELLDVLLGPMLEVEQASYRTPECRNVAIGRALEALGQLWERVRARPEVLEFVRRQRKNPRAAAARRAMSLARAAD